MCSYFLIACSILPYVELDYLLILQRQGEKVRRLANLLGYRDPEVSVAAHSASTSHSDPVDETDSASDNREEVSEV